MHPRARTAVAVAIVSSALLFGACGGGGQSSGTSAPTTAPAPAAKVDPNSNGAIAGPVNRARSVVTQQNQQLQQEEQQTGG